MPTPDSRSQSDIQTPIEPDFDPQAELQRNAAQRAAEPNDSLSDGKTTGGIVGDSTSSADLKAAADHLDDVEFEFVDLSRLYDIFEPLGEGGMGAVYRAIEKQSRHPLAIKRLKSDLVTNRRARARFQSEGNAMLRLTHENIVRFFRMGCDAISPFYVMELVAGGSLKDRLEQGKLELDEAVRMFVALAGGLSLSHRTGIIHRDIKPGNILLTPDGVPKLSDFGIARQVEGSGLTSTGAAMGTPFYMAPEQHKDGKTATELSDLYSLAATLYHAVTGELPISVRESRIPEPVRALMLKALETDPGQRQPSVSEFASELREVQLQLYAPAKVTIESADLKDGECPSCHTINPTTRKFCKSGSCGKALYEPCPSCQTSTPVWDAICAECGTNIPAHWEAAELDLQRQAQQIETLAAEQRHSEAIAALQPFLALTPPRWKSWRDWAHDTVATQQALLTEQEAQRDRLHNEAQDAFQTGKYPLVVSLLDQIHASQITPEIRSLRASAISRGLELDHLIENLKQQVKTKDYDGLRRNVDRVLIISPGDTRVAQLNQQLTEREEAIRRKQQQVAEAARQLEQKRAEEERVRLEALRIQQERIEAERRKQAVSGTALAAGPDHTLQTKPGASAQPLTSTSLTGTKPGDACELLLPGGIKHKLLWCPPGTFLMGSPASETNRSDDEQQVSVTLTKGFWLGQTVITQAMWIAVMKSKPWSGKGNVKEGADYPAVYVNHIDATAFCGELTKIERAAGRLPADWQYALPTEAQWEYACRAGTSTAYSYGDDVGRLEQYAWFDKNAVNILERYAHAVGTKKPNPWGFYDMHGNVLEWCSDWYTINYSRVHRGGSWNNFSWYSRSANRDSNTPDYRDHDIGFRVIRTQ